MGVIIDVILAIAEIAVAAGAVAEFQIRIAHIGASADGAAVGEVLCLPGCGSFFLTEGNGAGRLFLHRSPAANILQEGEEIQNIFAGKQKEIQDTHQREQAMGEEIDRVGVVEDGKRQKTQLKQTDDPGLYRNNKRHQKVCICIEGGEHENDADMQI